MNDEKPDDRLDSMVLPEDDGEEAEVYALENLGSSWGVTRRDVVTAAGAAAAAVGSQSLAQAPACSTGLSHASAIRALAMSADGMTLVSAGADSRIKYWKLPEGAHIRTITPTAEVYSLLVDTAGAGRVLAGLAFGSISVHSFSTGAGPSWFGIHTREVTALALSPDGRFIASGGADGYVYLLDPVSGEKVASDYSESVSALAFTPDSEFLIVGYSSGLVRILSVPDLVALDVTIRHSRSVNGLAVTPDGQLLISCSDDNSARLWSLPTGEPIRTLNHGGTVSGLYLTNNGLLLITACGDGQLRMWSIPDGVQVRSASAGTALSRLASSPNGAAVATSSDKTLRLWSVSDARSLLDCMIDLDVSPVGTQGSRSTLGSTTYTLPCGSPIPAGAICTCNCVSACGCVTNCSCVGFTCSCVNNCGCVRNVSHYWYPN